MNWKQLRATLLCLLRSHDWKRAVRHTAVSGTQVCRRCGARRPVLLRTPARTLGKSPAHAEPYGTDSNVELPTSQWPTVASDATA